MRKPPRVRADPTPLRSNPFSALLPEIGELPEGPPQHETNETPPERAPVAGAAELDRRLVVRRQKKGQGGKTVTCVEGLGAASLRDLAPRIKRELGCGARVDGNVLVVGTGEHARVAAWLREAGATRVVLGN
jgi:translation initiation factor 1